MKYCTFIFFMTFGFISWCQEESNCHVDSTRMIKSCIENLIKEYYNEKGELQPSDYDSVKYDFYDPDRIVIRIAGGNLPSRLETSGKINNLFNKRIPTPENYPFTGPRPDSITIFEHDKIEQFIDKHKDSLQIDTLIILDEDVVHYAQEINYNILYKCTYKSSLKHGNEFFYYSTIELKSVLIKSNFKLKCRGEWRNGKKHGKWIEYDKSGNIISIKRYKRNKLINEKHP